MRIRIIAATLVATAVLWGAFAQEKAPEKASALGVYDALGVEADVLEAGLDGTIQRLEGNVRITLLSDDPEVKPLPISADKVTFTYPEEGGTMPERVLLEGNAVIERPEGTLTADRADWDFDAGILVLTGNPVMNTPTIRDFRGEEIRFDFNANTIKVIKGKIERLDLSGPATGKPVAADPSLLKETDVKDWKAFLTMMKEHAGAAGPSPSRRILDLFEPGVKSVFQTAPIEDLLELKGKFLKSLNKLLTRPEFYDESAWKGVAIPDEAASLLKARAERALGPREITRLNRLLLGAAYPELIVPVSPALGQ